jgi:hypothetical protein
VREDAVNTVRFERLVSDGGRPELLPVVDGVSLADLVERYEAERGFDVVGGYGPVWLDPKLAERLRRPDRRARVALLGCAGCGEVDCWPLELRIEPAGGEVSWHSFRQPHRRDRDYSGFGPFRFDAAAYLAALREATQ